MTGRRMTPADLEAALKAQAAAPPDKQNELLVRYLQCKETLALTEALNDAISRTIGKRRERWRLRRRFCPLSSSNIGSAVCAGASFARRAARCL